LGKSLPNLTNNIGNRRQQISRPLAAFKRSLKTRLFLHSFFSPLGMPAQQAIHFAGVNFFLFIFFYFSRRTIISRPTGPTFAIFTPNESVLIDLDFF